MSLIWLQAIKSQDHLPLFLQLGFDPFRIGEKQGHQLFIAVHQMGDLSFGDHQSSGLQTLMHLGHTPMLPEAPGPDERNDIQAKLSVGEYPPSFFFRAIADMILWTGGEMALADCYSQLNNTLQSDHCAPTVVGDPPAGATLGAGLLNRSQTHVELCFGFGGSP